MCNINFDKQGKQPVKYQHLANAHLKTTSWTYKFKFTKEKHAF